MKFWTFAIITILLHLVFESQSHGGARRFSRYSKAYRDLKALKSKYSSTLRIAYNSFKESKSNRYFRNIISIFFNSLPFFAKRSLSECNFPDFLLLAIILNPEIGYDAIFDSN